MIIPKRTLQCIAKMRSFEPVLLVSINNKISLSLRPSKILSSSLPVQDREISNAEQLKVNDIVRGFVRKVADNGLFVTLGHNITAYVRVSDLSDSFIKEWKEHFQEDQLVKGRIIFTDAKNN